MTIMAAPVITEPGVYDALPEDEYHADPVPDGSLSSSGARKLLPPSCPAIFRHEQDHGSPRKRTLDLGRAAHTKVLGAGGDIVVVRRTFKDGTSSDADDYRTASAQDHRDAIYAEGKNPLLAAEAEQVEAMASALRAHPVARVLFSPERGGKPEQSLFWRDGFHDVWRRARLDWLPPVTASGRLILADYKTAACAEPGAFRKVAFDRGYHQQDPWYRDAVAAVGLAGPDDIAMVFVVQEKTPPYPVTVCELDYDALRIGRVLNQQALAIFAQCQTSGVWPGYSDRVELISPPPWLVNEFKDVL